MSNIYYDLSAAAANSIKSAMSSLAACSRDGNCPAAFPDLHLCEPQPNTTEWASLYSALVDFYKRIPQFSYPRPAMLPVDAILTLVNLTLSAGDSPGAVLRAPIHVANWQTGEDELAGRCANWTSPNATVSLGAARKGSWGWITCNFVMTNQYSIGEGNMLPSTEHGPPADGAGRVEICQFPEWAGPMSNFSNEQWIDYYGFSEERLAAAERLVFINGQWDPIAGASVVPGLVEVADRNKARSLVVNGLAHTEDLMGESLLPRGKQPNLDMVRVLRLRHRWYGDNAACSFGGLVLTCFTRQIRDLKREYIKEWTAGYRNRLANVTSSGPE
jgi:hypothetical protein